MLKNKRSSKRSSLELVHHHPGNLDTIKINLTHKKIHIRTVTISQIKINMIFIIRNSNEGRKRNNSKTMDKIVQEGRPRGEAIEHTNTINMNITVQMLKIIIKVKVNIRNMIRINKMIRILRKVKLSKRKCTRNLKRELMIFKKKLKKLELGRLILVHFQKI